MVNQENREVRGLFRSVSKDGRQWMFVILPDDGWAIRRDEELIIAGSSNRASLDSGVRKFLALTLAKVGLDCLPRRLLKVMAKAISRQCGATPPR